LILYSNQNNNPNMYVCHWYKRFEINKWRQVSYNYYFELKMFNLKKIMILFLIKINVLPPSSSVFIFLNETYVVVSLIFL